MSNYKLNEQKMFADITDGVAIIINSDTGIYYGMNELGTIIYENIVAGVSIESILNELISIGNVPATLKDNFDKFIKILIEKEILLPDEAANKTPSIDKEIAEKCDFAIELKEYNDAQEMLLADPIHEIDEETGWTPDSASIKYSKEETLERENKFEG